MSLVWPAPPTAIVGNQPRLHAFIVGVGDYPHLIGGVPGALALDPLGLKQVTTPRFTAPAIATWLIANYQNAACPLGSVELLGSPASAYADPSGVQTPVASATMANIRAAFASWLQRCSLDAGNIAFFYFCGHGIQKTAQYLLPEDFGNPTIPNAWANCIEFDGMRVGMYSCLAQTQLFFIDACRDCPPSVLSTRNVTGDPLITSTWGPVPQCSAVYHATHLGLQAYGPSDDVSFFGQALLRCLSGVGASKLAGQFVVSSYSLGSALGSVMDYMKRRLSQPLSCNPDISGMSTIVPTGAKKVLASISYNPKSGNPHAHLNVSRNGVQHDSAQGQPKPMEIVVEAGEWSVLATFPGGQHPNYGPSVHALTESVEEVSVP